VPNPKVNALGMLVEAMEVVGPRQWPVRIQVIMLKIVFSY
jgi:hypothetical protein